MKLKEILFGALLLCNFQLTNSASAASKKNVVAQTNTSNLLMAQITPDDTLGGESSTVVPNAEVEGVPAELIEGGAERGANLFHSFEEFNVDDGQSVYFANPADIENIFSRVTGGDVSDILGTLGVDGGADLFLINPNGIIFGENASLDVNGSFMATSASEIQFGEQGEFSATEPNAPPLLTVQPSALLFSQMQPGSIESTSITPEGTGALGDLELFGLRVPDGNNLSLIGGKVSIDGGESFAGLTALDGRIELGGLTAAGSIAVNEDGSLSFPENIARADVFLSNGAIIDVSKNGSGSVALTARNIEILDSQIFAQVVIESGALETQIGDIVIDAANVSMNNSIVNNSTFGNANAGKIEFRNERLVIENESEVTAQTFGTGNAGEINIQADSAVVTDGSVITNNSVSESVGNAGNINVRVGSLNLLDGGEISSFTEGNGDAGNIGVNASEIVLSGTAPLELIGTENNIPGGYSSGLISSVEQGASGAGGTVTVNTDSLQLSEGAVLSARTKSTAAGGDITIDANTLTMESGGQILTSAFDAGDAGNIQLNIAETINISGSDPSFPARREGVVELFNQIDRPELVDPEQTLDPLSPASGIFANTTESSTGDGGNVTINGLDNSALQSIAINDGGQIAVDSQGEGNGGSLLVVADNLSLDNAIISATTPSGQGGNLDLQIGDVLQINNGSQISAEASGAANGGNIEIASDFVVGSGNSDIIANAFEGRGGFIGITAEGIFGLETRSQLTNFNDITAFSQQNPQLDGMVEIITPDVNQNLELLQLPSIPVSTQVVQACEPIGSGGANEFVVTGRGGLPNSPGANLNGGFVLEDWRVREDNEPSTVDENASSASSSGQIVEADSWVVNEGGKVTLVADNSTNTSDESSQHSIDCPTN